MEEILLHQKFRYATISLLKNYCEIGPKQYFVNNDDLFSDTTTGRTEMIEISGSHKRPTAHYFYTKNEGSMEHVSFHQVVHKHKTTKDQQIKRHYNNPFAEVEVKIYERKIKRNGSKVILSSSDYVKRRYFNDKYFSSAIKRTSFSFDFEKGNFTVVTYFKHRGKPKVNFIKNSFKSLYHSIRETPGIFKLGEYLNIGKENQKIHEDFKNNIDDYEFNKLISNLFGFNYYLNNTINTHLSFYDNFVDLFVRIKKIKVPDGNYKHFLEHYYPTEKYFKKNDRKLIASVLDKAGIKSKITIKIFHNFPNIELLSFAKLCIILGENYSKYIANIDPKCLEVSNKYQYTINDAGLSLIFLNEFRVSVESLDISDDEKENVIKLYTDFPSFPAKISDENVRDIFDHFRMLNQIRKYDPTIRMRARSHAEFMSEHQQLSKITSTIKKGWVTEYQFDEKMTTEVEKPIKSYCECKDHEGEPTYVMLYPYILKREEDYNEEGSFMHHCVASYVNTDKSIIVSLRTEHGSNRVTSEFNIQDGRCIQSRHFCNGQPPEEFIDGLEALKDKIVKHARWGLLNWKEKLRVPVKINGVEIPREDIPVVRGIDLF